MNPIELVWKDLKAYVKGEAKPTNKDELVAAIMTFWYTKLTVKRCDKHISHLYTVCKDVIEKGGRPTGM